MPLKLGVVHGCLRTKKKALGGTTRSDTYKGVSKNRHLVRGGTSPGGE